MLQILAVLDSSTSNNLRGTMSYSLRNNYCIIPNNYIKSADNKVSCPIFNTGLSNCLGIILERFFKATHLDWILCFLFKDTQPLSGALDSISCHVFLRFVAVVKLNSQEQWFIFGHLYSLIISTILISDCLCRSDKQLAYRFLSSFTVVRLDF